MIAITRERDLAVTQKIVVIWMTLIWRSRRGTLEVRDLAEQRVRSTRVIAVGNQKGGVGKTTNTVHIATALGEIGRRCLVWDLDMNYGTTRHLGIPGDAFLGTFEVLMGEELAENVIIGEEDADVKLPVNVNVIPSRRKLEQIDDALSSKNKFVVRQHVLLEPLRLLARQV